MNNKSLLGACALALGFLTACGTAAGQGSTSARETSTTDALQVVTTIFPEYDWVRAVAGEGTPVELTQLLDNGVDLHSYQATAEDLVTISNCDLLIYVGGPSSAWVEETLQAAGNPDRRVINLMELLGEDVKAEEIVEGMEAEHEHDEEESHGEDPDEHVWLSLKNAQRIVPAIAQAMAELDTAHAQSYQENAAAYCRQLEELDAEYQAAVSAGSQNVILFGDRFPFRYLADDYGLTYYAAFPGCSAETEASFATVAFLAEKVKELHLPAIFTLENSDQKLARTIADNAQADELKILTMDSMQATAWEAAAETSYLDVMRENLAALQTALQ